MGRRRKISGLEVSHMEDKAVGKPKNSETVHMCDAEDREELLRKLRCRIQKEMETEQYTVSDLLWNVLLQYQKEPFYTVKGLEFTYYIKGNELFVSRKDKSITRASVDVALQKAMELNLIVSGPKKLTSFGASYLYPIFLKLEIIRSGNQTP